MDDTAEGETRNLVHVFGSVHTPESRPLGEDLYSNLTSLLENESIKVRDLLLRLCTMDRSSFSAFRENRPDFIHYPLQ